MLSPEQFSRILSTVRRDFDPPAWSELEISLEANPGTLTQAGLEGLSQAGFNRLSLGMQSAHPEELHLLERIHDFPQVIQSVSWARQADFHNLNLDLIFGLPEQTLPRWQDSLRRAVDLGPEHLSLYALTIEDKTPFGRWSAHGLLPVPDPDLAADMYLWASDFLETNGYQQYEISNWSKPGYQCRHNLQYRRDLPYLGIGAGAHGFAAHTRVSNVLLINAYISRLTGPIADHPFPISPAAVHHTRITPWVEMQETMMTGLRLTREGVSSSLFQERFGVGLMETFGREVDDLLHLGLLEWVSSEDGSSDVLRLTSRGRLLGNQVFMRFVG